MYLVFVFLLGQYESKYGWYAIKHKQTNKQEYVIRAAGIYIVKTL